MSEEERARERRRKRLQEAGDARLKFILGQRENPVPTPPSAAAEASTTTAAAEAAAEEAATVGRLGRQRAEYRRHRRDRGWALRPTLARMLLVLLCVAAWRGAARGGRSVARVDGLRVALLQPQPFPPPVGTVLAVAQPDASFGLTRARVVVVDAAANEGEGEEGEQQTAATVGVVRVAGTGGLWHPAPSAIHGRVVFSAGPLLLLLLLAAVALLFRFSIVF